MPTLLPAESNTAVRADVVFSVRWLDATRKASLRTLPVSVPLWSTR